jgi:hypothetical protein
MLTDISHCDKIKRYYLLVLAASGRVPPATGEAHMLYHDFTITVAERQPGGYPVTAAGSETGRVSALLPEPPADLCAWLSQAAVAQPGSPEVANRLGVALFRWLFPPPVETHLRVAWDRSQHAAAGLRLRLSIDPPEVAAWPWELLRDPARDHLFSASTATPLLRYFDQADRFGSLARQEAELPLNLLLVLPDTPDLDLAAERRNVERVVALLPGSLHLHVLDGKVTRADLADALLVGAYQVVHFSGHGAFVDGRGYIGLNRPDGAACRGDRPVAPTGGAATGTIRALDWVHDSALSQLTVNQNSLRLMVLNVCSSGKVDDGRAFQGLAPQLVRYGVPAVIAMQFAIGDAAAATFSQEFYKCLCVGEGAGQVDVAVAYARGMLAVLTPGDAGWAAPVLYTHAPDGVIFTPRGAPAGRAALDPVTRRSRLEMLRVSLEASGELADDWTLAGAGSLFTWRQTLRRAAEAYRARTTDSQAEVRQVAAQGLSHTAARLEALERALAEQRNATDGNR